MQVCCVYDLQDRKQCSCISGVQCKSAVCMICRTESSAAVSLGSNASLLCVWSAGQKAVQLYLWGPVQVCCVHDLQDRKQCSCISGVQCKFDLQDRKWSRCDSIHLSSSSRLCPSTAGCSPPSMSSIFVCLLLS